jgi:4-amino-4-deoxy-L-arabinose transferase
MEYKREINLVLLRDFAVFVLLSVMVFAPWLIYIRHSYPLEFVWESKQGLLHFTTVIEERTGPFLFHLDKMRLLYGEGVYLALLWFLYRAVYNKINYEYLVLVLWIVIPYVVYTIAETKMQAYPLIAAPAVLIVLGIFIDHLLVEIKAGKNKWVFGFLILLLLALPIRYSIERIKPFTSLERSPAWSVLTKKIVKKYDGENAILFGYPKPIEAMFYSDGGVVYPFIPSHDTIDRLIKDGYKVYLFDKEKEIVILQAHD